VGIALGLALGTTTFAIPAGATPQGDLASKTAQAQRLEAQIEANSQRADILDEKYLEAQNAVAAANHQIASAERSIAAARAQEAQLRTRLGGRAALLYMGAGSGDPLGMDATNVQELGSRAKYGDAAAETDNRMIDQLRVLDEQLGRQTKDLEKQKADAQKQEDEASKARGEVARANAQIQQLLGRNHLFDRVDRVRLALAAQNPDLVDLLGEALAQLVLQRHELAHLVQRLGAHLVQGGLRQA